MKIKDRISFSIVYFRIILFCIIFFVFTPILESQSSEPSRAIVAMNFEKDEQKIFFIDERNDFYTIDRIGNVSLLSNPYSEMDKNDLFEYIRVIISTNGENVLYWNNKNIWLYDGKNNRFLYQYKNQNRQAVIIHREEELRQQLPG